MSLTKRERKLVTKIGECMSDYAALVRDDGKDYYLNAHYSKKENRAASTSARENDITEFCTAVHVLQRQVMARSAQRSHASFPRNPRTKKAS